MSPCRPCLTSRIGSSNKASYLSAPASPANILSTFPPTAFQDDINFYDFVYSNVKLEKKFEYTTYAKRQHPSMPG